MIVTDGTVDELRLGMIVTDGTVDLLIKIGYGCDMTDNLTLISHPQNHGRLDACKLHLSIT